MDPTNSAYIPITEGRGPVGGVELSPEIADYYQRRWNLIVLDPTSATGVRHPDTGEAIAIGLFQIESEAAARFPELATLDAIELVVVGARAHARSARIKPHSRKTISRPLEVALPPFYCRGVRRAQSNRQCRA